MLTDGVVHLFHTTGNLYVTFKKLKILKSFFQKLDNCEQLRGNGIGDLSIPFIHHFKFDIKRKKLGQAAPLAGAWRNAAVEMLLLLFFTSL